MWRILVNLAFIAVIAFFGSKVIDALVYASEPPPAKPARADDAATLSPALAAIAAEDAAQQILDRNLMHARIASAPPVDPLCKDAENIVGTVAANRNEWSYVLYRDPKTQETEVFSPRAGRDQLPSGATLLAVQNGEIRMRVGDHVEICGIATRVGTAVPPDGTEPVRQLSAREWQIDRAALTSALTSDCRIVPAFHDQQQVGFKVFSVLPHSLVRGAGIIHGDTITAINDVPLTSAAAALDAYESLKSSTSATVRILRRGETIDHTYQLR